LVIINSEIHSIRRKLEISEQIKIKRASLNHSSNKKNEVIEIRLNRESVIHSETSIYNCIKENFAHFVKLVLDKDGRISTEQNSEAILYFMLALLMETSTLLASLMVVATKKFFVWDMI
jgi:hypothetical protein